MKKLGSNKGKGFDFRPGKHERRQGKTGAQHIADTGFTVYVSALRLQRGDVPVNSTETDAKLVSRRCS
jgi:hypothetical protein